MRKGSIVLGMLLALMVLLVGSVAVQAKELIYTTSDLKQDYEILGICWGFARVETGIIADPFEGAWNKAWKDMDKRAKSMGADAVIYIYLDFENITPKQVGRLILYGTAVKFKAEETQKK